jgi:hypothetical protein
MLLARIFMAGVVVNAWLTRRPTLRWIEGRILTPFYVRLTYWVRGRRPVTRTAEGLGREWERLMPSTDLARITRVENGTAYGAIYAHCPLRGTGDVEACHRMMGYDRGLLARHGGRLVVLESQAEPGRKSCVVAIRPFDVDSADLVPAHLRARRAS